MPTGAFCPTRGPFVPFISAQVHQRQQAGRRRGRHICPRRAAQRPPRPWSPHNRRLGLTGTASGASYATLWATYYRHGFEVSYNIMALTDATSFLRGACGAQMACASANDRPSISSSPPEPTMNAIYISRGGLGDDGLPSFYTTSNVKRTMCQTSHSAHACTARMGFPVYWQFECRPLAKQYSRV